MRRMYAIGSGLRTIEAKENLKAMKQKEDSDA
jgi:hypothetical protein